MDHKPRGTTLLRFAVLVGTVLLLAAALAFAAIGSRPSPTVTMAPETAAPTTAATIPPDSATPAVVLDAYLGALQAGDCDWAGQLVGSYASRTWHDALCGGETRVTGYRTRYEPHTTGPNMVVVSMVLTTTGTSAGLPPGDVTFAFALQQEQSGAWRIVEWYPGAPLDPAWTFPTRS